MKIFALSHYHYEDSSTFLFTGPDDVSKEQFRELCYSLADRAAINTIIKEKKDKHPCSIGWRDVVESMVPLLEKQGYHRFNPVEAVFGGGLINSHESWNEDDKRFSSRVFTAILNFNKEIRDHK